MNKISHILFSTALLAVLFTFSINNTFAQRKMENLDRGTVAVQTSNGVFVSWRIFGTEWYGTTYNIYRDGIKLNDLPLKISNYTDPQGTLASKYTITAIENGTEKTHSSAVNPLPQQYKEITLKARNTNYYEINDATAADLDGDGQYEIIVKRMNGDWSAGNDSLFTYFEAYKQDGTILWEINVGPNIMSSSGVEINIAAFDFDEDGKAEVFMRTSEGTIFGDGTLIGDTDNDGKTNYRYSVLQTANMQYMNEGPEFLSLIDGENGVELDRVDFIPRYNADWWGDGYGHRANKFFFGAPYLDGKKPSLFIGRGIYTKTVMRTYDVVNKKLQFRWEWKATSSSDPYFGQGNHNYTIADVDMDGRDEIVWGSMAVDDDGTGLYSTRLGHGDAMHVGDLDPFRKGMEAWRCLENSPVHGTVLHDAATGEILIHHTIDKDCGRCCAANISDDIKGKALWGGNKLFSASTLKQEANGSLAENFRIYWDGDLLEELLDHVNFSTSTGYGTGAILKHGKGVIFTANGALSCNYTKGTPSLQADLFGDWREEVVWRNQANTAIRIYTTIDPTIYRNYTLMHDHQYRQAVCWQMCGYNQPPHVSYFLGKGEGITTPPPPAITNNRLVFKGGETWDKTSTNWKSNNTDTVYTDDAHVLFDILAGNNVSLTINETLRPKVLTVNSEGNYTFNTTEGKLSGSMPLVKQGTGSLFFNGTHDFTGSTEIWNGKVIFNGILENSPVELRHFTELYAEGELQNNVNMRYGSILETGQRDTTGTLFIGKNLSMENGARIVFDLYNPQKVVGDSLIINGNFTFDNNIIFSINTHYAEGIDKPEAGDYLLATVKGEIEGEIDHVTVEGLSGIPSKLKEEDGKIYLEIKAVRQASTIEWNGDKSGSIWDLSITDNFLNNGSADIFVDQDEVVFNDNATSKTVNINSEVTPSAVVVNATENYTFQGSGSISGNASLSKAGSGLLYITNTNDFTGKVSITEGTLLVKEMPNAQANGAIGAASNNPDLFEINGGMLAIMANNKTDRALKIGINGGTIRNTGEVQWNEAITGGTLTKTGSGNLILAGRNTLQKTILKEGTISLYSDDTNPGKTISLEGGTLQCNDNSGSYSTLSWNIDVPEGKTANIRMDSRGYYTGNLTGSGTLNVYIPFVRTDLNGDMTGFDGTLNCFATGSSADLRINNSKGLPNAMLVVNSGLNTYNDSGSSIIIGALSGNGSLTGSENYRIGSKNIDSEFKGTITAGSITKVGSGTFTLSNNNSYAGGTTINEGTLRINNTSGSATGNGNVTISSNGHLTGEGRIGGNVAVNFLGTLAPGTENTGRYLTIDRMLLLKSGAILEVKSNPIFKYVDHIVVSGSVQVSGTLKINNTTSREYADGDEYQIFECSNISGSFENINPETPGEGLVWDTSELETRGVIKVATETSANTVQTGKPAIYPNPTHGMLSISNNFNSKADVSVTNTAGKCIFTQSIDGSSIQNIDLTPFNNGIYFIRIETDENTYYQKIVKQ